MVLPEVETDVDEVASIMRGAHEEGKDHALVVVAEGAQYKAEAMARHFKEYEDELGFKLRVVTLGHVQRGGHRELLIDCWQPGCEQRQLITILIAPFSKGGWGDFKGTIN